MARYSSKQALLTMLVLLAIAAASLLVEVSPVSASISGRHHPVAAKGTGAVSHGSPVAANSPRPPADRPAAGSSPRAPGGPPLVTGTAGGEAGGSGQDASASVPSSTGDQLVSNGLGSPSCSSGAGTAELSASGERNCQLAGFQATGAPTSNYAFDVHIDTGALGLGSGAVASAVQDLLIMPVWLALVWVVHALIVGLEWCFTIDLLNSGAMSGIASGLRTAQATFTQPWLTVVLAIASVLAAYHGLVRRRVAETLGQALLVLVMVAGGLWVIADPMGTVGALGEWTNQASLGALGAVAQGSPDHAQLTLSDGMEDIYATGVGVPWCYMEFGNVHWCDDPHQLDPRLHKAALALAAHTEAGSECPVKGRAATICSELGIEQAQVSGQSARLLREARTNGELFLALPANGPQRNSINKSSSLLRVLCDSEHATSCHGPTAQQAEFRTEDGTWPRAEGLLLILIGSLGMILLLGFIALRLLGAAIMSLFYLLLAPAAVLAPALGDGGRAAFRGWATRLLGALTAKLLYSLMLGVVLLMMRIVLSLGFGWWIQWLLASVLWWGAFRHRDALWSSAFRHHNQVLSFAREGGGAGRSRIGGMRLTSMLMTGRETTRLAGWAKGKLARGRSSPEHRARQAKVGRERAKGKADEQVTRSMAHDRRDASTRVTEGAQVRSRLAKGHSQLGRVRAAREEALKAGDTRRVAKLDVRAKRIEGEATQAQQQLDTARSLTAGGERVWGVGEHRKTEERQRHAGWLDAQAALPDNGAGTREGRRRDYPALAGLVDLQRSDYERQSPSEQRKTRLNIDRELRLRRELNKTASGEPRVEKPQSHGRKERKAAERFDREPNKRMSTDGGGLPPPLKKPSSVDAWREAGRRAQRTPERTAEDRASKSSMLDDSRNAAAARNRQFGPPKKPRSKKTE
jgi:hypothetical protein